MRTSIRKLAQFCSDIAFVLEPGHSIQQRGSLAWAYARIFVKNSLDRWFRFRSEHFLGLSVTVIDYGIFFEEFRQIFVREVYRVTPRARATVFDGGGNLGLSALYFALCHPGNSIVVFEPTPDVLVVLRRNIEQNGLESRIRIVDAALAATDGTARLFARGTAACGNTIAEAVYASDPHAHDAGAVTTVQTVRLSSFLSSGPIVLKLDIEGNEGDVMRELVSSGTLTRIDEIVMEYHYLPGNASNDLALMLGLLRDAGFAYQIFVEEFVPGTARALEREGNYPLNIRAIRSLASVAA